MHSNHWKRFVHMDMNKKKGRKERRGDAFSLGYVSLRFGLGVELIDEVRAGWGLDSNPDG